MTLCLAWSRQVPVLGSQLLMATDSMVTGGLDFPHSVKLFPFARNDCAICWEGEAFFPYAMIANIRNDIDYSDVLSGASTDIRGVAQRALSIINDLWSANLADPQSRCKDDNFSFIFAGYSHREQIALAWHINRPNGQQQAFELQPLQLPAPYYIGSGKPNAEELATSHPTLRPEEILQRVIDDPNVRDVGGPPQLLTIDRRGVENVGIIVDGRRYLFGKELSSAGHGRHVRYVQAITDV